MSDDWKYETSMEIQYCSKEEVNIVKQALEVDKDLQPHRICRTFSQTDDNKLIIHFKAVDMKVLRVSMSGIFDMLIVATKMLSEFSPT